MRYVYVGNVHDPEADSTRCHQCGQLLIGRDWYKLTAWNLTRRERAQAARRRVLGSSSPSRAPGGRNASRSGWPSFAEAGSIGRPPQGGASRAVVGS